MGTIEIPNIRLLQGVKAAVFPDKIAPMLATSIPHPFSGPEWIFEPKLDGFRGVALINKDKIRIMSRRGHDLTRRFGSVAEGLNAIGADAVLDGEITAIADDGRPCFECLQQHIGMKTEGPVGMKAVSYVILYYIFDIAYLNGFDLTGLPLVERKKVLSQLIHRSDLVQLVDYFENNGELLFEKAVQQGFEGIVAKRKDSVYEPGIRSKNWLKAKGGLTGEFIIGGYVASERTNSLSSIVVGQYETGQLRYKGIIGTGMSQRERSELLWRLASIQQQSSPFADELHLEGVVIPVNPKLMAEIKFTQWSHSGYLREPMFVRLLS